MARCRLAAPKVLHETLACRGQYRYAQCFIAVFAHARGFRVGEVATPFHPRHAGESFLTNLPFRVVGRIVWEIAKARLEFARLRRQTTAQAQTASQPFPQAG